MTRREESSTHVQAFELWYASDKDIAKTAQLLATSDPPVNVSKDSLYRWKAKYNWDARARERDERVARQRADEAVKAQVDFLNRKANYGKLLQKRALEFLNPSHQMQNGQPVLDANGKAIPIQHVTNAATAVQVLQAGILLEQSAIGLPEWLTEVLQADEQTLRRVYETAVAEFARTSNVDADAEGEEKSFAPVEIRPLQPDSKGE